MELENYKYIVVEGPIGVGKTRLAEKLAERLQARTLLARAQENVFLERFYRDGERYGLQTQTFFLLQRMQQLAELSETDLDHQRIVSDFLFDNHAIFAAMMLPEDELALYQQLRQHLHPLSPQPDLVIYLQAEPDTLIERVRKRDSERERNITADHIRRMCEGYSAFFHHYETGPLLIVNIENLNPLESDQDLDLLLAHIANMRGKREFFNLGA